MTKFLLPLVLVGAAAPAFAGTTQDKPLTFERDGIHYVATVKTVGTVMMISGREVESGRTFDLRAKNGRVDGTYGTSPVSYTIGH